MSNVSKKKRVVNAIWIFVVSGILLLGLRCYLSHRAFSGPFDGLVVTTTKGGDQRKILLYDNSGSRRLLDFPEGCSIPFCKFVVASEAHRIAIVGKTAIYIMTLDGKWILEDQAPRGFHSIAISPDGEHLVAITGAGNDPDHKYYAYIKHIGSPDDKWTEIKLPHAVLRYISLGPEGKTVVYEGASDDSSASYIYYYKLGESGCKKLGRGWKPKLSADGTLVIWTQRDKVVVYDIAADTSKVIDVSRVKSAAISPNNKFLALQITPFFADIEPLVVEIRSLESGSTIARFWRKGLDSNTLGWMTTPTSKSSK